MSKILFVDNKEDEYKRFLKLPFAQAHSEEIEYLQSPVKLKSRLMEDREHEKEIRLIILDLLWEEGGDSEPLPLGVEAMQELSEIGPDIPVVIYSVLDDDYTLNHLMPQMMTLGAYDWVGKAEPRNLRSFRFERAYMAGREGWKSPPSRSILSPDQQQRSKEHVAIMFVDMSGFTALTKEIGGESVVKILKVFYALVGEYILANGGYIDKYIGDAVMAVFGAYPKKEEGYVHVSRAISASRQIQNQASTFRFDHIEPILNEENFQWPPEKVRLIGKFRIGIESGPVEIVRFLRGTESEVTFVGTAVNIASRVINLGEPGEIWIGENAHGKALSSEVGPPQRTEYRNLPGEFNRYQILQ